MMKYSDFINGARFIYYYPRIRIIMKKESKLPNSMQLEPAS